MAARRRDQAEQHPQHRRLAGAVRAEQADHAARLDLKADAVDGANRAKLLGERVNGEIEHARDSCRRRGAHGILTCVTSTAVERSATKNGRSSRASSGEAASTSHQIACSPQRHEARAPLRRSGLRSPLKEATATPPSSARWRWWSRYRRAEGVSLTMPEASRRNASLASGTHP